MEKKCDCKFPYVDLRMHWCKVCNGRNYNYPSEQVTAKRKLKKEDYKRGDIVEVATKLYWYLCEVIMYIGDGWFEVKLPNGCIMQTRTLGKIISHANTNNQDLRRMPKVNRLKVYNKYQGKCGYCGNNIEIKDMQVDHITPLCSGNIYVHKESNLMPTCRTCNHYKRSDNLEQFRHKMGTLHERVCSHYIGKVAIKYSIVNITPFDGIFYFEKIESNDTGRESN